MKEVTMIVTCEITTIDKLTDEDLERFMENTEDLKDAIRNTIKSNLNADDVNILKNQIFIRD